MPIIGSKDIFTRLVKRITVRGREDITFEFKDGTEAKAETGGKVRFHQSTNHMGNITIYSFQSYLLC
jgi:hypothetical protein